LIGLLISGSARQAALRIRRHMKTSCALLPAAVARGPHARIKIHAFACPANAGPHSEFRYTPESKRPHTACVSSREKMH
jgi:hypothetical protein